MNNITDFSIEQVFRLIENGGLGLLITVRDVFAFKYFDKLFYEVNIILNSQEKPLQIFFNKKENNFYFKKSQDENYIFLHCATIKDLKKEDFLETLKTYDCIMLDRNVLIGDTFFGV